jgi:hypothetical protein
MIRAILITARAASGKPIGLDYEASRHLELGEHSHPSDLPRTVEIALFPARRLHRAVAAPVTHSERAIT